jgi:hypothetical protein
MVSFNRCEKEMVSRMEKTVPSAAFFVMLSCCSSTGGSIVNGVPVKIMAIRLRLGMFYFLFLHGLLLSLVPRFVSSRTIDCLILKDVFSKVYNIC